MAYTKIATCCYCGTRAALVLKGETRHELACSGCGAPLHDMKHLKSDKPGKKTKAPVHRSPAQQALDTLEKRGKKKKSKKKKKSLGSRFFDEAFDLLDDIFD